RQGSALSLSSMPRLATTPNGFNEWLVCEAVEWARREGFTRVSLNFAPFAALLAPEAVLSTLQRVERRAILALKGHFQLDNLLLFNRKFGPSWERRFVVYERRRDLPRVGIAALAAEAYLPFASRERAASGSSRCSRGRRPGSGSRRGSWRESRPPWSGSPCSAPRSPASTARDTRPPCSRLRSGSWPPRLRRVSWPCSESAAGSH